MIACAQSWSALATRTPRRSWWLRLSRGRVRRGGPLAGIRPRRPWVVRTALNANISRWRRRGREMPVPDPGLVADRPAITAVSAGSVDPRIMAALRRLPARQRQVIALRLILDLDTNGTAEMLGITPNTVMAHMARALAALRHDLMPERQKESPS
jgi:DNA-directed RNA polymerase specialized sigma24 family protein